ncbi:MAG: hypothetical protein HY321_19305 [Armatimonadetes bacterium]|nr:hypothetical protein [Armatimonadota bacterium]
MTWHRLAALLLVAVEAGVTGYEFERPAFAALVLLLAAAGAPGWVRLRLRPRIRVLYALTLGAALALRWWLLPRPSVTGSVLDSGLGYGVAQYLLLLQASLLFLRAETSLPPYFPLLGAIVMVCTGDLIAEGVRRQLFLAGSVAFACLFAAFFATSQPRLRAPARKTRRLGARLSGFAVLLGTFGGTAGGSWLLGTYKDALNDAFNRLATGSGRALEVGFTTQGDLNSIQRIKTTNGDATALRVRARANPGYLRGKTYDRLARSRWSSTISPAITVPLSAPPTPYQGTTMRVFPVSPGTGGVGENAGVTTLVDTSGVLFTGLGSRFVAAGMSRLRVGVDQTVRSPDSTTPSYYELTLAAAASMPRPPPPLDPEYRQALLSVPPLLDPGVLDLAARLFADKRTTAAKISAVVRYFRDNYRYHLGLRVPRGKDPLTYFLLERPPAHCEYFASGAALLLRLGGVPCRYVSGFVAVDRNLVGDYWNVRNKDAHAWVEAFDEKRGWVTVEATVAEGVPSPSEEERASVLSHLWDYVKEAVRRVRAALDPRALLRALGRWVGVAGAVGAFRALILAAGVLVIGRLLLLWMRRRPGRRIRRSRRPPPQVERLQRLRQRADRRLRAAGFTRGPGETLHQFAARLELAAREDPDLARAARLHHAAGWYVSYALARYGSRAAQKEFAARHADAAPIGVR